MLDKKVPIKSGGRLGIRSSVLIPLLIPFLTLLLEWLGGMPQNKWWVVILTVVVSGLLVLINKPKK